MTKSEREALQKRIVQFYLEIANKKKNITVNHFAKEKIHRQTVYSIIKKYEDSENVGDKPRSGRPRKLNKTQMSRLRRRVDHKTGVSLRRLGSKFRVNHQTISNYLKDMNINYYKKRKAPKYNDKQLREVPSRARRLYQLLLSENFQLVMDDEKYFTFTDQSTSTNRGFYSSQRRLTPFNVKLKQTRKYEPKILVWVAVSENGISSPYFAQQGQAVTGQIYLHECIMQRLTPFINTYHQKKKVLFWPDLASSHYSGKVTSYLKQNGIRFVTKNCNPQNCPQARPVETFWSILKNMVYDEGWEAKNLTQLQRRIAMKLEEIDITVVQKMFSGIKSQLRKIAHNGPYEACSS